MRKRTARNAEYSVIDAPGFERPTVSIIVPVYNAEAYVEACVESILAQEYRELEVILVDDGSTDSSGEICDQLAARDDRVVVIHRENGGIAAAQNSGLDRATGELLTFCDNDDLMAPRMIARMVDILLSTGSDMSSCRWQNVGASHAAKALAEDIDEPFGRFIVFDKPGLRYQTVFSKAHRLLKRRELEYFSEANWGKLYRTSLFDGIRFPEGRYAQDVAIAMDLYERMGTVASCEDPLYYWLQHPESVSHSMRSARYFHDIVSAHAHSFDVALAEGYLPARAYLGMMAVDVEESVIADQADRELYEADRLLVDSRLARLTRRQLWRCRLLARLRILEGHVYVRTVHRRS